MSFQNKNPTPKKSRKGHKYAFNTKIPIAFEDLTPQKPSVKMPDINKQKLPDEELNVIDTDFLSGGYKMEQNNILRQLK